MNVGLNINDCSYFYSKLTIERHLYELLSKKNNVSIGKFFALFHKKIRFNIPNILMNFYENYQVYK